MFTFDVGDNKRLWDSISYENEMWSFIILVDSFSGPKLRFEIFIGDPVILMFALRIESVSVLWPDILRIQNCLRFPSLAVTIISVLLVAASFCAQLVRNLVFGWTAEERVHLLLGTQVGGFGRADPLRRLNKQYCTTQAGLDFWISVLPYLWLEAFLDLSIRASLVMLKPVVAKPLLFMLISGLANTSFVLLAKDLACKLSALSLGIKPA